MKFKSEGAFIFTYLTYLTPLRSREPPPPPSPLAGFKLSSLFTLMFSGPLPPGEFNHLNLKGPSYLNRDLHIKD